MKGQIKILLINSKKSVYGSIQKTLGSDFELISTLNTEHAASILKKERSGIFVISINPGIGDLRTLSNLKNMYDNVRIIVMSAYKTAKNAVRLFRVGAYDNFDYCSTLEELEYSIRKAAVALRHKKRTKLSNLSPDMERRIQGEIENVLNKDKGLYSPLVASGGKQVEFL